MLPAASPLLADMAEGRTTATRLVEMALAHATDPAGEGVRVFTALYADQAMAQAAAFDQARAAGISLPPLAGLPVTIKDLFDEAGRETLAGSVASHGEGPAAQDAPAVAALRRAGAIILGRTTMTEYAFSGLGLNPHTGTPRNPWDRANGRIPGGSSAGAAVSVSDGMAVAGLGSDTGGSLRIPAALCGLTGFKPTARRVSRDGAYPLSTSLDCIGVIARSVQCCVLFDQILSASPVASLPALSLQGRRLAIPTAVVLDQMDIHVAASFAATVRTLEKAGASIEEIALPELAEIPARGIQGGIAAAEAYALHQHRLVRKAHLYDPRVLVRILNGQAIPASIYIDCLKAREEICTRISRITSAYDALIMPTVPTVAPLLAPLECDDGLYGATNALMLRNTSLFNALDRPAISLPCHAPGTAPVGLMVVGETMKDDVTLSLACAIETALQTAGTNA